MQQVRLTKLDHMAVLAEREGERGSREVPSKLLRRPHHHGSPGAHHHNVSRGSSFHATSLSMKEREDDYHRARERIIGGEPPGSSSAGSDGFASMATNSHGQQQAGRGFGGYAGGSAPGMTGAYAGARDGGGAGGRGRGRKAVFRDKDREMMDPDYVRRDGSAGPVYGYPQGVEVSISCIKSLSILIICKSYMLLPPILRVIKTTTGDSMLFGSLHLAVRWVE